MAEPISYTDVKLMSGVPFNVDFKHTRWFYDENTQTTYFNSKPQVYHTPTANFQRLEGRFTFKCPLPIEQLENANYLRFFNNYGMRKYFYCFITHLEYSSRGMTIVHFELDPVQTFMFRMDFKRSYVVREHENRYNASGSPRINTIPEGLNYGNEYQTNGAVHVKNERDVRFFVIISKDPLHETEGDIDPSYIVNPQPLYYYFIPFKPNGDACKVHHSSGDTIVPTKPQVVMNGLYRMETTVNSIVSMYVTDDIGLPITNTTGDSVTLSTQFAELESASFAGGDAIAGYGVYVKSVTEFKPTEVELSGMYWNSLVGNGNAMPRESKTLMSPYHWIELHDFRGNILKVRPEYIEGNTLTLVRKGSLGTSNKVSYHIKNYNMSDGDFVNTDEVANEHSLIDNNPQDITVKNEHLAAFMQGNRNQLVNQENTAAMNGIFSMIGGGIGSAGAMEKGGTGGVGVASAVSQGAQGLASTTLQIQGIQAKQQDIANIPASISKMGNNTAYDVGNGYIGVHVVYKGIKSEYMQQLEEFFRAYGYKSNRVKVPNLRTRQHFNYVQTLDCIIRGDFPNKYIEQLKGIFNSGITLWHTEDIGNYALSNNERE